MNNFSKKILIISTWAPPMVGGPMNLYNIFFQFPKNSYCILTGYSAIITPPSRTNYWLAGKYFFYDRPNLKVTKGKEIDEQLKRKVIKKPWWSFFSKLFLKIFYFMGIGNIMLMIPQLFIITRRGIKVVREEKIDIMMGISGDGLAMISAYLIHKFTKKPYTLYLFDIYRGNNFAHAIRLLAYLVEPILFRNAAKIFLTNEGTKNLYIKRYDRDLPYEIIYNAVFPENYKLQHTPYNPKPPYTIVLTGHIYWPQERSVLNLIEAVKRVTDLNVRLKLYAPKYPNSIQRAISNCDRIDLLSASPSEMPVIQSQADILFLPLSWNTPSPEIIATATPGKLTDYLIAGRPILIHAPGYAYITQYAQENNFALAVDEEDTKKLRDGIRKLLLDNTYANQLIKNAQKTFYKNHDAKKNAQKLTKTLNEI